MGGRARELIPLRGVRALERLRPAALALAVLAAVGVVPVPTCLLRLALHVPCPACGLTRASLLLLRGDIVHSARIHPIPLAVALGLPVVIALAVYLDDGAWKRAAPALAAALAIALLGVWLLRFAGLLGGPVAI